MGYAAMTERNQSSQARIDRINELVRRYKQEGDEDARIQLLEEFHPFLLKHSRRLYSMYYDIHPWDDVIHEAQVIFCKLLDEFIIDGDAYFNVYMERKLPLRLRYFFIQEIGHRKRNFLWDDDKIKEHSQFSTTDYTDSLINRLNAYQQFIEIMHIMKNSDKINDREIDMLMKHIVHGKTHQEIAAEYNVSRSRVSHIIRRTITKIRKELGLEND